MMFLRFFILLFSYFCLNESTERFDKLHTLLNNEYWKIYWMGQTNFRIIEYDSNGSPCEILMDSLLPNEANINNLNITEENFEIKVRQAHLVLSMFYALQLDIIVEIAKGYWGLCIREEDPTYKCKFQETFTKFEKESTKMFSSLHSFADLLNTDEENPTKKLTNEVHTALISLKRLSSYKKQSNSCIEDELNKAYENIKDMLNKHQPDNSPKHGINISKIATTVNNILNNEVITRIQFKKLQNLLNIEIKKCNNFSYNFGFIYDKQTERAFIRSLGTDESSGSSSIEDN